MGKPYAQACSEVDKSVACCQYLATQVNEWIRPERLKLQGGGYAIQSYEPIGVIVAIMPWNFPLWQVIRAWVPALLVGNAVLLSPAPCTQGTALLLKHLADKAGCPEGLFQCLVIDDQKAHDVIAHPQVDGVTFTGSQKAGAAIAASAGQALKKSVLELGGSDPYLVLEDADLKQAARCCVEARLVNAGQVCIAAKRLIIHESIWTDFLDEVCREASSYQLGDPFNPEATVGPLARSDLRAHLHSQVQSSLDQGAIALMGGVCPEGPGFFYPVTVLIEVQPGMPAYHEELFGPVISCIKVHNETEAIRVANDTPFGLTAAVFSASEQHVLESIMPHLKVGSCAINQAVHSQFDVPFGGVKRSGYGRELGRLGCLEFVNAKACFLSQRS